LFFFIILLFSSSFLTMIQMYTALLSQICSIVLFVNL
jgi:hypothetical protein